jgi:septum formation protein
MLILASQSAARKALLAGAGLRFATRPAQIDERALEADALGKGADAAGVANALAVAKALAVSGESLGAWVIGADQTLACDGMLYHKPAGRAEAAEQLGRLAGRSHSLNAGVALARDGAVHWSHVERAELTMRMTDAAEREAVLDLEGEAALGSVGGYRLEGPSIRLFERVEGDYFTILGLPLLPLLAALRRLAPELLEVTP